MTTPHGCPEWREMLSAYHDTELTRREARHVESHLAGCADCRRALAAMTADRARFTAAYAASTGGEALRQAVLEELAMQDHISPVPRRPWLPWAFGLTAGFAALCLAGIVLLLLAGPREIARQMASINNQQQIATDVQDNEARVPLMLGIAGQSTPKRKIPADPMVEMMQRNGFKEWDGRLASDLPATRTLERRDRTYANTYDVLDATDARNEISRTGAKSLNTYARNFGVPGGMRMTYDVDYLLQTPHAFKQARAAQELVRTHGGFIIDFTYADNEGERPSASLRGKVPAAQAEKAFEALEQLGRIRALTIAGEDITQQYQQALDEMARQQAHAGKLDALGNRTPAKNAPSVETMRHTAAGQALAAKRNLFGLKAKQELVEFSATFFEEKPRAPFRLQSLTGGLADVLRFLFMALITLGTLLLVLGITVSPFWAWKRWMKK